MILTIVVVGLVLMFLAFVLALFNMSKLVDDKTEMPHRFKVHLASMGIMGLGTLLCLGGIIGYVLSRL